MSSAQPKRSKYFPSQRVSFLTERAKMGLVADWCKALGMSKDDFLNLCVDEKLEGLRDTFKGILCNTLQIGE